MHMELVYLLRLLGTAAEGVGRLEVIFERKPTAGEEGSAHFLQSLWSV